MSPALTTNNRWLTVKSAHANLKSAPGIVDIFATLYHGCPGILCGHERDNPLKVEHYLTVVGRALGIEHEDLFKKYMPLGDTDAILADTSACAAGSGLGLFLAKAVIQKSFVEPRA